MNYVFVDEKRRAEQDSKAPWSHRLSAGGDFQRVCMSLPDRVLTSEKDRGPTQIF
jgi:hypothetical protein